MSSLSRRYARVSLRVDYSIVLYGNTMQWISGPSSKTENASMGIHSEKGSFMLPTKLHCQ